MNHRMKGNSFRYDTVTEKTMERNRSLSEIWEIDSTDKMPDAFYVKCQL